MGSVALEGFGGGGGASLNFDVKDYATEEALLAATPKENTIGIITPNKMTGWVFSATEPAESPEGMVWISTGTSSDVEFNALKKNGLQVYPEKALQYVGGAWEEVPAYSFQGETWHEWDTSIVVFDASKLTAETANAMFIKAYPAYSGVSKEGEYIKLSNTAGVIVPFHISVPYDITDISDLIVEGYSTQATSEFGVSKNTNAQSGTAGTNTNKPYYDAVKTFGTSLDKISLKIDGLSGDYYVCFSLDGGQSIYLKTVKLQ